MRNFIIRFSTLEKNIDSVMGRGLETIQGKTAKDALKRKYGRDFSRVTAEERNPDVLITSGYYDSEKNRIHYENGGMTLGFNAI